MTVLTRPSPSARRDRSGASSTTRSTRFFLAGLGLALLLTGLLPPPSAARDRFEEGDWTAWPDLRQYNDFEVGRDIVYVAAKYGILRWSRQDGRWLDPWFSVPSALNSAYFLRNIKRIEEDPLNFDLYVELPDGWLRRIHATRDWDEVDPPSGALRDRLERDPTEQVTPDEAMITPHRYFIDLDDHALSYRNQSWPFEGGVTTGWGDEIYGWNGYGLGTLDTYQPVLKLYPQGVGRTVGLAVTDSSLWAVGELDHDGGWLWKRNRSGTDTDRWFAFQPAVEWGLEAGTVQALQVDNEGAVWLATDHGLMFGDGKRFRHLRKTDGLPSERLWDVEPMTKGAWLASRFGLSWVEKGTGEIIRPDKEQYPLPFGEAWSVLASDADTLYAAGTALVMKHTLGGGWDEVEMTTTVGAGTQITALWAEQGFLAVGDRNGLAWRTPDGTWKQVLNNRFDDGYVYAIDFHGGYFWLGTDRGLVKYDPVEGDAIVYNTEDGLPGNTVYEVIGDGDHLWLGTDIALVRFLWNVKGRQD